MKILDFTLPLVANKSIITKEERLPHFYQHLHRHIEIQLTWIIEGEGTLIAGNNMHAFHDNEIYWIGAKQPHVFKSDPSYFKNLEEKKTHSIDIFFNIDSQLSYFFSLPEMLQLKTFIEQHQNGFKVPGNKINDVAEKIALIRNTVGVEQFMYFIDLLKLFSGSGNLDSLSPEAEPIKCTEKQGLRIAEIYNYIMKNYRDTITLDQVAKIAFMTPHAFCRYFKKHTHTTLVEFVNQVRINEACKQLTGKQNETIACVAYSTGFNSITNFNRVFKSVIKKSPKEYVDSYMRQLN